MNKKANTNHVALLEFFMQNRKCEIECYHNVASNHNVTC